MVVGLSVEGSRVPFQIDPGSSLSLPLIVKDSQSFCSDVLSLVWVSEEVVVDNE